MWHACDINRPISNEIFSSKNLSYLLKKILEKDDKIIIRYINEYMADTDYAISIPYLGDTISTGELAVAWAKYSDKWNNLLWEIADEIEEEILDCFERIKPGEKEIVYMCNYAITHD